MRVLGFLRRGLPSFMVAVLSACGPGPTPVMSFSVLSLDQERNCPSPVEGFFHSPKIWPGRVPVLFVKRNPDPEILYGLVVEQRADGVVFDQDRVSPFYDPKPELYHYTDLLCVVDQTRKVVYGELPRRSAQVWTLELTIQPLERPKANPLRMTLEPEKPFGFCLAPGRYSVQQIWFRSETNYRYVDQGVEFPSLQFVVEANRSNYLGDLYLDSALPTDPQGIVIPFKEYSRPRETLDIPLLHYAQILATSAIRVGTALKERIEQEKIIGAHVLHVEAHEPFSYQGKPAGVTNLLSIIPR